MYIGVEIHYRWCVHMGRLCDLVPAYKMWIEIGGHVLLFLYIGVTSDESLVRAWGPGRLYNECNLVPVDSVGGGHVLSFP